MEILIQSKKYGYTELNSGIYAETIDFNILSEIEFFVNSVKSEFSGFKGGFYVEAIIKKINRKDKLIICGEYKGIYFEKK